MKEDKYLNTYDVEKFFKMKFNVPSVFKEMVGNYQRMFPDNRKLEYALLNTDLNSMIDFTLIFDIELTGGIYKLIIPALRLSPSSLHAYIDSRSGGTQRLVNYFHDVNRDSVLMEIQQFERFLNDLDHLITVPSKRIIDVNENGKIIKKEIVDEIIYEGLTSIKNQPNFFALPENLPYFFNKISSIKNQFDIAKHNNLSQGEQK